MWKPDHNTTEQEIERALAALSNSAGADNDRHNIIWKLKLIQASNAYNSGQTPEESDALHQQELRTQLVHLGYGDVAVANWVKRNYGEDFPVLDDDARADYRNRYIDCHQIEMPAPDFTLIA